MQELSDFILSASPRELQEATQVDRLRDKFGKSSIKEYEFIVANRYSGHAILKPYEWFPPFVPERQMTLWWNSFFPLEGAPYAERRGFGTLAHVLVLLATLKDSLFDPNIPVVHVKATDSRINQITKMGLTSGLPFDQYLRRSIDYANCIGFSFSVPEDLLYKP